MGFKSVGKPRVVFSANTSWYLFNYYRNTFAAFMDAGYEVFIAAPVDAYTEKLRALGCVHLPLPIKPHSKNPFRELAALVGFFRVYHAVRPDVAFHFTIKCNLYGSLAARLLDIPHANSISGLGSAFNTEGWFNRFIQVAYRVLQRKSARIFFQSASDRDFMVERSLVTPKQVLLLSGSGVDLSHFKPNPKRRSENFVFIFAGRILWEKGFAYLAEAMRLVKREDPRIECQVYGFLEAGNPKYVSREQLAEWEDEGLLRYRGPLEDVRKAHSEADCVVLPTYYREGIPKSLLEAAAAAKPLLATDLPGCREAVKHGVNGMLCAARDAESLAEAMLRMARMNEADLEAMGRRGRALVEAGFGEDHITAQYLKVANALIS
ncbi:MAG: glycosyltransferase family 1 protein [Fibrobacteria bacterium]|jgi:glycosyltransferase involved in cell wall biosynthesis|nr:glycosyltransferase family 1 protein [Fibrobacteria bacterium]